MIETTEKRKCVVCKKVKITTVRREEESIFVCEQCLRGEVRTEYLKMSGSNKATIALIMLLIVFVIGFCIGKYLL